MDDLSIVPSGGWLGQRQFGRGSLPRHFEARTQRGATERNKRLLKETNRITSAMLDNTKQ